MENIYYMQDGAHTTEQNERSEKWNYLAKFVSYFQINIF